MKAKKHRADLRVEQPPSDLRAQVETPVCTAVVLAMDGVSAYGKRFKAGSVIAPNVDGWPDHRVNAHLRDGRAT